MVNWVWGKVYVSYTLMFKIASKSNWERLFVIKFGFR